MINNFYFLPSAGPLVPYFSLHIGREQLFMQFMFRAYREAGGVRPLTVDAESGLVLEVNIPSVRIESYADWRALLRATPGVIMDSASKAYSLEEFEARVAENSPHIRELRNPLQDAKTDAKRNGRGVDRNAEWNDAEGFTFNLRKFG